MSRATWIRLQNLQKTANVFTDGLNHLMELAPYTPEDAADAVREFCEDYSKLEAFFKNTPREGDSAGAAASAGACLASAGADELNFAKDPKNIMKFMPAQESLMSVGNLLKIAGDGDDIMVGRIMGNWSQPCFYCGKAGDNVLYPVQCSFAGFVIIYCNHHHGKAYEDKKKVEALFAEYEKK
jgi:hypothetical protein